MPTTKEVDENRCPSKVLFTYGVDAVEVVRCKDCKHNSLSRRSGNAWCELGIELFQLDDFCSHGKRKDE